MIEIGSSQFMTQKRILVIDDNEDLVDALSELIELQDHEVDVAFTGCSGVKAAAGGPYDFIFLDIGLPDIDGIECARRIRKYGSKARILFMTGYSAVNIPARVQDIDAAELMTKPLDPNKVLQLLR
jgi:DNA-binding response OmpR family regulator